jgi:SAM-dependent methyltransferase
MTLPPAHFDQMFADSDDPWKFRSRWYEVRKRAMTLACLPAARFSSAFEPGCANGELTAELATRCDRLLAMDLAPRAVALARERLAGQPHVQVVQGSLPGDWPAQRFDLIVISEIAYFLAPDALPVLAARVRDSLEEGGTVLACHWRRPIPGCALGGDEVHAILGRELALPHLGAVVDADCRIDLWSTDGRSVGQREGLA